MMKLNIRPVCGRVLLQIFEEHERISDGIIVAGSSIARRDGFRKAVVRALPNGYAGTLDVGSTVLVGPYRGTEVIINRERLVFVKEHEIEAALEG
jgi:co-chaperonin GroES (HSP10)